MRTMAMDCQRVTVPEGANVAGWTAAGRRVRIAPGDYVVHRLRPKVRVDGVVEALRFVGADPHGGDVHVPLPAGTRLDDVIGDGAVEAAAA
ncbi:MAG: hypothetical protein JF586_03310 [Burkholderiales bacterium]|nr:hypothetical protein [Burkholderiales bacterium]